MNIPYKIEVHDNLISTAAHKNLWEHIQTLQFCGTWLAAKEEIFTYSLSSPKNPYDWMVYQSMGRAPQMHRVSLASDEAGLKAKSLPIYLLWKELNHLLGDKYELTGNPEDMHSMLEIPNPIDTQLDPGWRAYINANYNSHAGHGGQGYVHRDTPLEYNDDKTVTMLYVANTEWYPSWAGEVRFYPEDPTGSSGENQQFNIGEEQRRGYNVGWLDCGRVVSPVPGRLIIYDGRCLHGTTPTASATANPSIKIAFRARRKFQT